MALDRLVKNMYIYKKGSNTFQQEQVTATSLTIPGNYVNPRYHFQYRYSGNQHRYSLNSESYTQFGYVPTFLGKLFSYKNYMSKIYYDSFIDYVNSKILAGFTGIINSMVDPNTASNECILFGLNTSTQSNTVCAANVYINIMKNVFNATSLTRDITFSMILGVVSGNWNGQHMTGNLISAGSVFTFHSDGYDYRYSQYGSEWVATAKDLYKYTKGFSYTPGTGLQSSGTTGNVVSRYDNQFNLYMTIVATEFDDFPGSRVICIPGLNFGTTYGGWTRSGSVDPTDPSETPTPKPPEDPDPPPPDDPWDPFEPDPDPTDPIEVPDAPDIGGVGTAFFHVYSPSAVTLRLIGDAFWSTNIIQQIVNYFTSPLETILGLGIVPVKPQTGEATEVHFGLVGSGVNAPPVLSDYVIVNCGTRYLEPYYNSYLDYEPYTKMSMYIPYVGEFDLNPDEVTGKTIGVKIYVNVITGDLVGMVTANGTLIYTGASNCFRQLPVTQADMSAIIQTAVSAAGLISGALVGGAGAVSSAGVAPISTPAQASSLAGMATEGDVLGGAVGNAVSSQTLGGLASQVAGSKLHYHRCGQIGTGSGQLAYQKPFLTILRPNLMLPDGAEDGMNSDLKAMKGYPSNQIMPLTNATGMTVIEDCRLSIPGATDQEIAEALEIMKGGYIA